MSTTAALRVALAVFVAFAVGHAAFGAQQENILLIICDDLGVDGIAAYAEGNDLPATPIINELANNGVLFRRAYGDPNCSPTRSMIMTGRYGFRTGIGRIIWTNSVALAVSEVTLPEVLDMGTGGAYSHAAFGKWHLGNDSVGGLMSPNMAGFGHFAGTLYGIVPPETYYSWTKVVDGVAAPSLRYATVEDVNEALTWILKTPEPWFLHLGLHAPHSPFHVPPPVLATYEPKDSVDPSRAQYKAMVEAMDTELGRLLTTMPPAVKANTNIIITSDNGTPAEVVVPPFNPAKAKNTIYEGGIRVPLIVKGPRVVQPGREIGALVNSSDLFATVAQLAGVDVLSLGLPTLDSVSILPYLTNPAEPPRRQTVFSERFEPNGTAPATWERAMRNSSFKLIRRSSGAEELFQLNVDPFEGSPLPIGELNPLQQQNYDALRQGINALVGL